MANWSCIGVVVPAFDARIVSMCVRKYSGRWQPTSTAFDTTSRATRFGDGYAQSLATKWRIIFGGRIDNRIAIGGSVARERFLAIPDGDASSAAETGNQEKAILVNRVLDLIRNEFEDRTWQAFWRVTVECQPSDMVAESLEMTPAAVRQAKSRVLRRLREEMQQLLEQEERPLE